MTPELQAWIDSRPECVRKLCYEFPLGTTVGLDGVLHHLIGYTEADMLILSPIDPRDDYDAAREASVHLCAGHVREAALEAAGDSVASPAPAPDGAPQ